MLRVISSQTAFVKRVWSAPVVRSFHASVVQQELKVPAAPKVKDETKVYAPELINDVAEETGLSKKDVQAVLRSLPEVIAHHISKEKTVYLSGVGVIKPVVRRGRTFNNPRTQQPIVVGDRKLIVIRTAAALKNLLK